MRPPGQMRSLALAFFSQKVYKWPSTRTLSNLEDTLRNISGIAFDLEGTVVNVEAEHHAAHLQIAQELGLSLSLDDCLSGRALPHFIGGPDEVIYSEMLALMVSPGTVTLAALLERKRALYYTQLTQRSIMPRPGWKQFMRALSAACLERAIGSLTGEFEAHLLLIRSGVVHEFSPSCIVLREDVKSPKPAPDVFLKTARRMGISQAAQLVFEDSPRGVQAALAAGSVAVGMPVYDRPDVHAALLAAGAFRTYRSWEDISFQELISAAENQA